MVIYPGGGVFCIEYIWKKCTNISCCLDKEKEEMVQEASESEDLGYEMEENS